MDVDFFLYLFSLYLFLGGTTMVMDEYSNIDLFVFDAD